MKDLEDGPFFSGRNKDGTISVVVTMEVFAPDVVALRAKYLLDPSDEVPTDMGLNAAVSRTLLSIIKGEETWAGAGLDRGLTNVTIGGSTSAG